MCCLQGGAMMRSASLAQDCIRYWLRVFCHRLLFIKKGRDSFSIYSSSFTREVTKKRRNLTDQQSREGPTIYYLLILCYSINVYWALIYTWYWLGIGAAAVNVTDAICPLSDLISLCMKLPVAIIIQSYATVMGVSFALPPGTRHCDRCGVYQR